MRRSAAVAACLPALALACSTSGGQELAGDAGSHVDGPPGQTDVDGGDVSGPAVVVAGDTPFLVPDTDGCLVESDVVATAGQEFPLLAMDDQFVLIDPDGTCLARSAVGEPSAPLADDGPPGTLQWETVRYVYGADGCPVATEELLDTGAAIQAIAKSHDASYHGFAVIDRALSLAPVRLVDGADWQFPWQASVQLVKQVPQGFVIGGGVLIGPNAILTADHLGADASWCYSREPVAGPAWEAGLFECDNIVDSVRHPGKVDARVLVLEAAEPAPYAPLRQTALSPGEAFYANRFSLLRVTAFADSTVEAVGNSNAFCDPWPQSSSFIAADLIVGGGDSGGPAFVGDELAGLVHGERCKNSWEETQHVFVHVPGIYDFAAPYAQ